MDKVSVCRSGVSVWSLVFVVSCFSGEIWHHRVFKCPALTVLEMWNFIHGIYDSYNMGFLKELK